MKHVIVTRLTTGKWGTFGRMTVDAREWWVVERPLTGDHPAIPAGRYPLVLGMYFGGDGPGGKADYPAYVVDQVPGRSEIKIHVANRAAQLRGCLAPGGTLDLLLNKETGKKELGVTGSADAFKVFMAAMDGQPGELTILEDL